MESLAGDEYRFPVVAIGADAGSVVATCELIAQLGAAPGLAVVVVQRALQATDEHVVASLAHAALMPVTAAGDQVRIQPNRVYVVPSDSAVELVNGRLCLFPRIKIDSFTVTDRLFESIAADAGDAAIGVVLGGVGSDGSVGARQIKAHGGLVFAQDASANQRSMPEDAVATRCVDHLLSPAEIGRELSRIASRRRERGTSMDGTQLSKEVPIPKAALFETPEIFDVLQLEVFPALLHGRLANDPIRVWVPGCGSGEEVYSLGVVLLEFLASARATNVPVQLFGTDPSGRMVADARKARFPMEAMRNVNERRRLSFFTYSSGTYEITKRVRELCIMAQHDTLKDPPLLHMDLISGRGLAANLHTPMRERIVKAFQYALKTRGFLMLERDDVTKDFPELSLVDAKHGIFVRTARGPRRSSVFLVARTPGPALPISTRVPSEARLDPSADDASERPDGDETDASKAELRAELVNAKQSLRSVVGQLEQSNEELRIVNEELRISNERLQRANEELTGAKEELIASNRELTMLNQEMAARNASANRLSDDLANVLNSSEIPIVILARNARIRRFTPAAAALFGLTTSDVGRSIGVMKGTLMRRMALLALEVLEKGRPSEARLQDDQDRWFMLTAHPYVTAGKALDGAVITAIDVDEATKVKERAEEARRYAENIVNTVRESLLVLDRDSRVLSANMAFYQTFELGPAQVEGLPLSEIEGLPSLPAVREGLERLAEGGAFEELRIAEEFPKLGFRAFVVTASRIERTPLLLLVIDDVTEKERAKAALKEQELEFREMLTNAAEGVVMAKADGTVVFVNGTAAQLFGYQADELLGRPVEALMPTRFRDRHRAHRRDYSAAPSSRPMTDRRDILALRKDGKEFPVEVVLSPMGRKRDIVVAFITDVSKRRESEEKIREYQDRLRQMAFDAAVAEERERRRIAVDLHDQIGQSLALARMKLDATLEAVSGASRRSLDEALELLSQSMAHVRTLTFDLSPPILYDLGLREALSWLVEDIEQRWGITVQLDADPGPVPLDDAAAALVFRAVRELLMNVFKHAGSRAAIVALLRRDDHAEIEVQDRGVGFDVEGTTARHSARGFGLFSVREQIGRLGGDVEILSAPGRGTRVILRVPLIPAGARPRHSNDGGLS